MSAHTWEDSPHRQSAFTLARCELGEDGDPCDECRDEFVYRLTVADLYSACQNDGDYGMMDYVVGLALAQARREVES